MDDLLRDFLTETTESLVTLNTQMVTLEQNPDTPGLLPEIFRTVHTIKGTCGFLGLPRLENVAHATETVLGKFRDGLLPVTSEAVNLILGIFDVMKQQVQYLEKKEKELPGEDKELIARLEALAECNKPKTHTIEQPSGPVPPAVTVSGSVPLVAPAELPPEIDNSAHSMQSIRVHVDTIEKLMTTVSELVLTRNQLLQISRKEEDGAYTSPLHRLNQITSDLQEEVMKTRMQPIGQAWGPLPRLVRDLSKELGKKIELVMEGADTELDRQVLELIKDPLTHMVRNSADHGIEVPEARKAAGKPETGTITLKAFHEGGNILIEIADNGRGLPLEKIKAKILSSGLATATELADLSEAQIQQFIFKPGFSTAAQVTSVSGRGVGMDVVKTNIEKIGGTVALASKEGEGTRFIIKIPLTLAIIPALIVESAGERFAIPQTNIVELMRANAPGHRIEQLKDRTVLRLREQLLPLISLRQICEFEEATAHGHIVVLQAEKNRFAIAVDRVHDTEEIVVKPMSSLLRAVNLYSGNTILGDGSVIIILDPNGLAARAGKIENVAREEASKELVTKKDVSTFLLFRAGKGAPKAVPLARVSRLESIDMRQVELAARQRVIQYRGKLMPLLPANSDFTVSQTGYMPVLVFTEQGRNMGLIVEEILDIVEEELKDAEPSTILAGKATDMIDAGSFLNRSFSDHRETVHGL